jgi:hypothetical protein
MSQGRTSSYTASYTALESEGEGEQQCVVGVVTDVFFLEYRPGGADNEATECCAMEEPPDSQFKVIFQA